MATSAPAWAIFTVFAILSLSNFASASASFEKRASELQSQGYVQSPGVLNWHFTRGQETIYIPYEDKEINLSDEVVPQHVRDRVEARRLLGPQSKSTFGHSSGDEFLDTLDGVNYWDFIPFQAGTLFPGATISWPGICFETVSATMDADSNGGTITFTASGKKEFFCNELYWLGNRQKGRLPIVKDNGDTVVTIDSWEEYEWSDIQNYGMHVYLFPGTWEDTLASVLYTVSLFWDPNSHMVAENKQFFADNMQWAMIPRRINQVNVSSSDIRSGDYLAILRMDGLDPMIAWGTGGRTGHTAVALWFEDGLYVCESTDTEGLPQLVYWPPPYGVIRTPYEQWIEQAMEANYHVALLPLAKEYSDRFDESAARAFFDTVEGSPYGWHNFMFTFLDTEGDNLPRPITPAMFEDVIGFLERLIPVDQKPSIYNMLIMGYNHRLQSNCTDLHCIYEIIDPIPMSLAELSAIPEQDQWRYGGNVSMVCDVFVCEVWKAAGIFEDSINDLIQCTEQTPKDTYQMAIYERDVRPKQCVEADYDLPYCQLMGTYQLTLPGFNSIALYPDMNHACPALPPVYSRTPGC